MEKIPENREKFLLAADSMIKKSKGFIMFAFDANSGNYLYNLENLDYMQWIGLLAYAKEKIEKEINISCHAGEEDDGID
jgi:hypothetical protein